MSHSSDRCPFGEHLQKYWNKRYLYFSRFDDGIEIDAEGLYSVTRPFQVVEEQLEDKPVFRTIYFSENL
jgi:hypothetical protein